MTTAPLALARANAAISRGLAFPPETERRTASAFHALAMAYLMAATRRRRWLRERSPLNLGRRSFYPDLWTPERAALVRSYRDKARAFRASARGEVGEEA